MISVGEMEGRRRVEKRSALRQRGVSIDHGFSEHGGMRSVFPPCREDARYFYYCFFTTGLLFRLALERRTHGLLRKAALHQEARLLVALGRIKRDLAELALPYLARPGRFAVIQPGLQFLQGLAAHAVALQLGHDAAVAEARRAAVDERLGKPLLRQPVVLLEEVEQGVDVVALLRLLGQLAPQLEPAVLPHRQKPQGTAFEAHMWRRHRLTRRPPSAWRPWLPAALRPPPAAVRARPRRCGPCFQFHAQGPDAP